MNSVAGIQNVVVRQKKKQSVCGCNVFHARSVEDATYPPGSWIICMDIDFIQVTVFRKGESADVELCPVELAVHDLFPVEFRIVVSAGPAEFFQSPRFVARALERVELSVKLDEHHVFRRFIRVQMPVLPRRVFGVNHLAEIIARMRPVAVRAAVRPVAG